MKANPLDVLGLYRSARRAKPHTFAEQAFTWLKRRIHFDSAVVVSTRTSSSWVDPQFYGIADPRALMESHARVRHLDLFAPRMLSTPFVVHAYSVDLDEIKGPKFAPFRKHLVDFGCRCLLGVTIPATDDNLLSTLMLIRGPGSKRFQKREARLVEACAPHLVEAFAVNRDSQLSKSVGADAELQAVALAAPDGRLIMTTRVFAQIMWGDLVTDTSYLPDEAIRALERSRSWPVPGSGHSLYAQPDDGTGWLLSLRPSPRARSTLAARATGRVAFREGRELQGDRRAAGALTRHRAQSLAESLFQARRVEPRGARDHDAPCIMN